MAASVPTVRGPVGIDDLGVVLPHEHLFVLNPEFHQNFPGLWDSAAEVRAAARRLEDAYELGVRTVVDMTVLGQGRDLRLIEQVARLTRVNIVLATGLYVLDGLPQIIRYRGPGAPLEGPDPLVELLEADITQGIAGSGVRAALVKFVCEADEPDATVRRLAVAAAETHRRTGVPVVVHTGPAGRSALAAVTLLDELGVDSRDVVLAHAGEHRDRGYLRELAGTGAYLGCDQFGMTGLGPDEDRIATVVELLSDGFREQLLLSQDCASYLDHVTAEQRAALHPDWDYTHLPARVLPALRAAGVNAKDLAVLVEDNPRRMLAGRPGRG